MKIFITRLDLFGFSIFNYRLDKFQLHLFQTPGCGNNHLRNLIIIAKIIIDFGNATAVQLAIQELHS